MPTVIERYKNTKKISLTPENKTFTFNNKVVYTQDSEAS